MRVESWIGVGIVSLASACARDFPTDEETVDGGAGEDSPGTSGTGSGGSTGGRGGSSAVGGDAGVAGTGSGSSNPADCVVLPSVEPMLPVLPYARACTLPIDSTTRTGMGADDDSRDLIVGRWRVCGDAGGIVPPGHAGIEFGENGRYQLLGLDGDALVPVAGAPRGFYYLLASGQLELRSSTDVSTQFLYFDGTLGAMQAEDVYPTNGGMAHLARVEPDVQSAALNAFSTSDGRCSLDGTWDTAPDSVNPSASFLFDADGEWFGGERGANLCNEQTMYGTYELTSDEFSIVTNVGAGLCHFWFGAGFGATFDETCDRVVLDLVWDNCTGGRGYLNGPGDVLIKRN